MDFKNSSSSSSISAGGNGGMSRAAKKRAKKQQKKKSGNGSVPAANAGVEGSSSNNNKNDSNPEELVQGAGSVVTSILKKRPKYQPQQPEHQHIEKNSSGSSKRMKVSTTTATEDPSGSNSSTSKKSSEATTDSDKRSPALMALMKETIEDLPQELDFDDDNLKIVDFLLVSGDGNDSEEGEAKQSPSSSSAPTKDVIKKLTAKQRAAALFQAIIHPITLEQFYTEYWEKKPLLVQASTENNNRKKRFQQLLSLQSIKEMSKKHPLYYGLDLNVTKYRKDPNDGIKRRITLDKLPNDENDDDEDDQNRNKPSTIADPETGAVRVDPTELWSNYNKNGCTIRLLCPHKYNNNVQSLLSTLEMEMSCMVGSNAYLTPPNTSQGFAPHYDDIEAFCLQLEGSKRWKVYNPIKGQELPRASSEDFTTDDIRTTIGEPVLDVTLSEGDLLYMPRGWIHQACTLKTHNGNTDQHQHSLHLTISAMQQWSWIDLLEMVMPEAVDACAKSETSTSLREGLPKGFMDYMGVMYEETKDDNLPESLKKVSETEQQEDPSVQKRKMLQEHFRSEAKKRIMKIARTACEMIDASCDEMSKRFISERQPPALTPKEKDMTAQGDSAADEKPILPNTLCRLVRPGIGRLVIEDDKAVVYHCADNSREYQGHELSPLEFEMDDGPALEQLLTTVEPAWIAVNDLYHDTIEDKIAIAQSMYDEGILAIQQPEEVEGEIDETMNEEVPTE